MIRDASLASGNSRVCSEAQGFREGSTVSQRSPIATVAPDSAIRGQCAATPGIAWLQLRVPLGLPGVRSCLFEAGADVVGGDVPDRSSNS